MQRVMLGGNLADGERPQAVVPAQAWQAAQTLGNWTLCGCTVAPGLNSPDLSWRRKGGSRNRIFAHGERNGAISCAP
jgi:predicted cupin superfamily sugar epimerase